MFLSILDEEVKGRWLADDDKLRPLFSLHDGNQTHLELLFFHSPQQSITNVIRQILHSAELRKINGLRRITSLPIIITIAPDTAQHPGWMPTISNFSFMDFAVKLP